MVQKRVLEVCHEKQTPVIVATEMLLTVNHEVAPAEQALGADAGDLDLRSANKRALLARFGLDGKNDAPLLSMLGRMTPQKGWRALRDAIPAMVDEGALVLAVGSGNAEYEIQLKELEQSCPGRVAYHRGFSEEIAHQMIMMAASPRPQKRPARPRA